MSDKFQLQAYNVKVVVQETGLKPETLRAWERRYGIPKPERSSGGHRLYSRSDIQTVKWLVERQEEGLSISNAVELWRSLVARGLDPLNMPDYTPLNTVSPQTVETIDHFKNSWISACVKFNERQAEEILTQAFTRYPIEVVCNDVLAKGLAEIGDGWYQGKITVQQEHFASELALRRIELLIAGTPPPTRGERILLAAPPEEEHDFILLLVNLLLRRRGWDVIYLGANVPLDQLAELTQTTFPNLVVSAAQQLHTAAKMVQMGSVLEKVDIPLAYGGRIFNLIPDLRQRVPGYYLGNDITQAAHVVEKILSGEQLRSDPQEISHQYRTALKHFQEQRPGLESDIWENIADGIPRPHLAVANANLARDIQAALELGNLEYLGDEINWIDGLLVNNQIPTLTLHTYLATYHQAAVKRLQPQAAPVVAWLEKLVSNTNRNGYHKR